jgi:hypothetical protein
MTAGVTRSEISGLAEALVASGKVKIPCPSWKHSGPRPPPDSCWSVWGSAVAGGDGVFLVVWNGLDVVGQSGVYLVGRS